jgi:hypothetical protein
MLQNGINGKWAKMEAAHVVDADFRDPASHLLLCPSRL